MKTDTKGNNAVVLMFANGHGFVPVKFLTFKKQII